MDLRLQVLLMLSALGRDALQLGLKWSSGDLSDQPDLRTCGTTSRASSSTCPGAGSTGQKMTDWTGVARGSPGAAMIGLVALPGCSGEHVRDSPAGVPILKPAPTYV
jgi:hypothetical protein